MALVRVNELRAQKSLATRHFDDMDDWMEDQEGLGLQQTLAMLVRHNSSRQPILHQQVSSILSAAFVELHGVSQRSPHRQPAAWAAAHKFAGLLTPAHLLLSFSALLLLFSSACTADAAGIR